MFTRLVGSSMTERKAYNVTRVAEMLGVSVDTVYELVRGNRIPHKRLGRRIIIPASAFDEWLNDTDEWQSSDGKN